MFCRLYVNGHKIRGQHLLFQICDFLEEKPVDNSHIESDSFSLTINKSNDYNEKKAREFPEGFIYFPINIEIDFYADDVTVASEIINKILMFLWQSDYSAVASCKFEELLLEKGGFNSRNIPWIR
jgi:hypothetical protein